MTAAPSQTPEAAGLEVVAWRVVDYEGREHGLFYSDDVARETTASDDTIMPLVTAASAQARIGELESRLEYLRSSRDGHAAQAHAEFEARVAAEARADRLAKGIVQAEILIDDAIKGIQTAPLSVVTDTIWTADPCPMTVVEALQLARAALQQETQP